MLRWHRRAISVTADSPVPRGLPEDRLFLWIGQRV